MCALVTGVQTCALPILNVRSTKLDPPSVPLFLRLNRAVGAFAQQSSFLCPILCVYQKRPRFAEVAAQLSHYRCPELLPARSCSRRESARIRTNLQFRSEEHTSELQSLMRISYAVFCLKKKKHTTTKPQKSHYKHNSHTLHNIHITNTL